MMIITKSATILPPRRQEFGGGVMSENHWEISGESRENSGNGGERRGLLRYAESRVLQGFARISSNFGQWLR
jgi:hypothetical protein